MAQFDRPSRLIFFLFLAIASTLTCNYIVSESYYRNILAFVTFFHGFIYWAVHFFVACFLMIRSVEIDFGICVYVATRRGKLLVFFFIVVGIVVMIYRISIKHRIKRISLKWNLNGVDKTLQINLRTLYSNDFDFILVTIKFCLFKRVNRYIFTNYDIFFALIFIGANGRLK